MRRATLGDLRADRAQWRADRDEVVDDADLENDTTPVLSVWEYVGCGYLNPGDALLAAGVEASVRAAREALLDLRRGPRKRAPSVGGSTSGLLRRRSLARNPSLG
jgi:hypothetical protein